MPTIHHNHDDPKEINQLKSIRFEVFGRQVLVSRTAHGWTCWYPGPDGKRRPASDLLIPTHIGEAALTNYLADLCHEWASETHPDVRRLD